MDIRLMKDRTTEIRELRQHEIAMVGKCFQEQDLMSLIKHAQQWVKYEIELHDIEMKGVN